MKKRINIPVLIGLLLFLSCKVSAQIHLGQKYKGGIVFYIDSTGQYGLISDTIDLPYTTWENAKKECEAKGDGWHLPTKDELNLLYKNKNSVPNFAGNNYWSSTLYDKDFAGNEFMNNGYQGKSDKSNQFYSRAVKTFNGNKGNSNDLSEDNKKAEETKVSSGIKHYIGERYLGGIIFYLDETGQNGLIVDSNYLSHNGWDDAKKECEDEGGAWRLPTKDELDLIYKNRSTISGLANTTYWSSTEYTGNYAWDENFSNGNVVYANKQYTIDVCAVRSFRQSNYYIGEKYLGGIVFYIDETGQHGLIAGTEDLSVANWVNAKKECEAKGTGWHLPTKDELELLYKNRNVIGGFADNDDGYAFWSSTEWGADNAWDEDFSNGSQMNDIRDFSYHVRPVRAF